MSFSQQALDDLQYSFNSLYTPSYSIAGLVPLGASPEEDFAPLTSTSGKTSDHASTSEDESSEHEHESSSRLDKSEVLCSSSLEAKKIEPTAPHYQKLKMNYFRRLNVVPGATSSLSEASDVAQKSLWTGKNKSAAEKPSVSKLPSKFISSFNPSPNRSSQPIRIPVSAKSSKPSRQILSEESGRDSKKKTPQMAFSLKREDSLDHFGVFDSEFEM